MESSLINNLMCIIKKRSSTVLLVNALKVSKAEVSFIMEGLRRTPLLSYQSHPPFQFSLPM